MKDTTEQHEKAGGRGDPFPALATIFEEARESDTYKAAMEQLETDEHGTALAPETSMGIPIDAPAKDAGGETPRTADVIRYCTLLDDKEAKNYLIDHAITLERENAALRDELAQVGGELLIAAAEAKDAKAALADGKGEA